jgi:hypothetical protein
MELRGLSEFCFSLTRAPYWVSARASCRYRFSRARYKYRLRVRLGFRAFVSKRFPDLWPNQSILSQTSALLQSVTNSIRAFLDHTWCKHPMSPCVNTPPFEVCLPTAFPTQRSCLTELLTQACATRAPVTSRVTGPCALRVSHSLDALLPAEPLGLISFRIRSWDFPFEVFILTWCRTLSRVPQPS